jgi:hypothetical protein
MPRRGVIRYAASAARKAWLASLNSDFAAAVQLLRGFVMKKDDVKFFTRARIAIESWLEIQVDRGWSDVGDGPSMSRGQCAAHSRRQEFPRPTIRQQTQAADRRKLQLFDLERTGIDERLESLHRHLIESTFDFVEASRAVGFEICAPTDERHFAEDQVRPRKHGEKVTAEGMKPGRPEADKYAAARPDQLAQEEQNLRRIIVVLKPIDRGDHVGLLDRAEGKLAAVADAGRMRRLCRHVEHPLAVVDPDDAPGTALRHFDRIGARPATEIDDVVSPNH